MRTALALILALTLSAAAMTQHKPKPTTPVQNPKVYVTKTGVKYHKTKTCPGLKNAKDITQINLSAAYKRKLKICEHCREHKKPTAKAMGKHGG
jgi:hypothetical protein